MRALELLFETFGRPFDKTDLAKLRAILDDKLREGWAHGPFSRVKVEYATDNEPGGGLSYTVTTQPSSNDSVYSEWVATRTPPLFGEHADAKVLDVASSLGEPQDVNVLDAGAGTGRNTLPLARAGYATDALEPAAALANVLRGSVESAGLNVRVIQGDILDERVPLTPGGYQLVILAEVVASHFREVADLRKLFQRCSSILSPGGVLLINAFLAVEGYRPDDLERQFSHNAWSCIFTRTELSSAASGTALQLISDESVYEYEKSHLPPSCWPPTGWFEDWVRGLDVFGVPRGQAPIELRWLKYQRDRELWQS